jgi:hypothetical protein
MELRNWKKSIKWAKRRSLSDVWVLIPRLEYRQKDDVSPVAEISCPPTDSRPCLLSISPAAIADRILGNPFQAFQVNWPLRDLVARFWVFMSHMRHFYGVVLNLQAIFEDC